MDFFFLDGDVNNLYPFEVNCINWHVMEDAYLCLICIYMQVQKVYGLERWSSHSRH